MILTVILLIASGVGAAGWMSNRKDYADTLFVFLVGIPVFLGTAGLLLADAGRFDVVCLSLLTGFWGLTGLWRLIRKARFCCYGYGGLTLTVLLFGVTSAILFSRPHTYLHGGWDPGEYVCGAAQINRIGSIRYTDPLVPELGEELYTTFSRIPLPPRHTLHAGYLVLDAETGAMVPDYFHLYPVWLAVFHFDNRIESTYAGQWVISIIALLLVFLFLRRSINGRVAFLGTAGLLANPAVLYFGRFPSSEMLSMALLFGCLFFLMRREENRDFLSGIWLAVTAFAAVTCHIINLIPLTAMMLTTVMYGLFQHNKRAYTDTAVLAAGMGLGILRNSSATPLFVGSLFRSYIMKRPGYVVGTTLVLWLAVLAGFLFWKRIYPHLGGGTRHTLWRRWLPGGVVLVYGLYQYYLRPQWGAGHDVINLRSLGWLFSPLGLGLVFAAFFMPPAKLNRSQVLFLAAGGLTTVVLLQNKYIHPLYMWAFRRYIPMVIPFFAALLAYTVSRIVSAGRRFCLPYITAAGFIALLGWQLYQGRHLIRIREHKGLPGYVETLAAELPDADFILIDHWKLSTPLRIAFGLPVYQLSHEAGPVRESRQAALYAFLLDKLRRGTSLLYLSHTRPFFLPGYHPRSLGRYEHRAETLRRTRYGLPQGRQTDYSDLRVFRFEPGPDRDLVEVDLDIGYHSAGLIGGFHGLWRHSGRTGRWTDGNAALYIPALAEGGYLTLSLQHGRPAELLERLEVTLLLDGEPLATLSVGKDWADYIVELPPTDRAAHRLSVLSDTWDPGEFGIHGHPDDLGVSMTGLRITRPRPDVQE